jgi:hypothetical protein
MRTRKTRLSTKERKKERKKPLVRPAGGPLLKEERVLCRKFLPNVHRSSLSPTTAKEKMRICKREREKKRGIYGVDTFPSWPGVLLEGASSGVP